MPEEIEVPIEKLHESIQEEAEKAREKWVLFVALSTAILAVLLHCPHLWQDIM